jgi:hypothetical protein
LSLDDLKHPRINIIHIPERKQDALDIRSKYLLLGATVTLTEVDNDEATRENLGRLYYFDEAPRVKEIATSLARSLHNVELVSPCYVEMSPEQQAKAQFSIWIVKSRIEPVRVKVVRRSEPPPKTVAKVSVKSDYSSKTICSVCAVSIRKDWLAKHLAKVHRKGNKNAHANPANVKVVRNPIPVNSAQPKQTKSAQTKQGPITLISKRGTRVNMRRPCDSCHCVEPVTWRYERSNRGTVYICGRCKSGLFNRSFEKRDALNLAFQGGAFEINRRRH